MRNDGGLLIHKGLTDQIIGAAIEVHRILGPGLLESAYEECMARELVLRGLSFRRQVPVPLEYKGMAVDCGYRLDLMVEDKVIVELKAVLKLDPVFEAQLLTYLRLTNVRVGLLINFHTPAIKDSLLRRVL